jgi:hypothetical protein
MPTCIWAFKLGNGEGGKNRWFGRRRDDLRPANAASELMLELRLARAVSGSPGNSSNLRRRVACLGSGISG